MEQAKDAYIYLIYNGEQTKIGVSVNVDKRLKALQTGSASKLSLLRKYKIGDSGLAYRLEKQLHKMFFQSRCRHNGEWFELTNLHITVLDEWLTSILEKQNSIA